MLRELNLPFCNLTCAFPDLKGLPKLQKLNLDVNSFGACENVSSISHLMIHLHNLLLEKCNLAYAFPDFKDLAKKAANIVCQR
jgi:hypothetical protein